jgi:hypothetical protein
MIGEAIDGMLESATEVVRSLEQARELTRLGGQLAALRRILTASLALAEALQAGTIDKVLAKDDVELAVEYLRGKRKL